MANASAVDHEISLLVDFIKTLGTHEADGTYTTTFGALFKDDKVANTLESLAGTLKAAKKRKIVSVSILFTPILSTISYLFLILLMFVVHT